MRKTTIPPGQTETIFAQLRESGFRWTRQRQAIIETFLMSKGHLSAEELYRLVQKKEPSIGLTTVFRTLRVLADSGLAQQVDLSDGRARFERIYQRPYHYHLVCSECHRTIEFLSPVLEELRQEIVAEYRFEPLELNLQILGLCERCQVTRS